MNAAYSRRMIDYTYWAHRRVWEKVMRLSDEQFTRPCDYSVGSVHQQVVHTMSAERLWLARVQGNSPAAYLESTEAYPTRDAVRAEWDRIEVGWRAFAEALTDSQLEQTITYTSINGNTRRTQVLWEGLAQIINHATDHRAQILFLLHQLGGTTDAQDFVFYSWEHPLG
jgi:uncharacterized damage-inducible protein DinB